MASLASMATPCWRPHCDVPATFCRPVFDPGGSPPMTLSRTTQVGALCYHHPSFSVDVQSKQNESEPINLGLLDESETLHWTSAASKQNAMLRSADDASSSALFHKISILLDTGQLDQVLQVLLLMYAQGVVPHLHIYWSYLKACNQRCSLLSAKRLHAHLVLHGLEFVGSLGDYLLNTLLTCGGFEVAIQVFHMLPHRTVFTWKAIITGYIKYGLQEEAMTLYEMMLEDGVEPDKYIYASLIKACGCLLALDQGKVLHSEAQERFLHVDVFVGSALLHMYGKCKSLVEAENVFIGLWVRDVVSWNAMLSVYAEQGEGKKALRLYRQMHEEGPRPNNRTFVAVISACCILGEKEETVMMCLAVGEALHADAWRMGFASDTIIGNNLLTMYGKCGSIIRAQKVFKEMSQRSVVSWTLMLNMYLEQGQEETTLQLYRQMQEEGVHPDERIFVVALQACHSLAKKEQFVHVEGHLTKISSLTIGKALHFDAKSNNFDLDVFVGSTLVGMYGMCWRLMEAENVFVGLSRRRTHVSFNAMLSAYIEQGEGELALQLYRQMEEEGVESDERTIVIALQACCILAENEIPKVMTGRFIKSMSLEIGRSLHCDALRQGFSSDVFVSSTLLSMYRQCGSFIEAKNIVSGLVARSSIYWIEVLSLYVLEGETENALQIFKHMHDEGISPNKWVFVLAIQACCTFAEKGAVGESGESALIVASLIGQALQVDAWKQGFSSDVFVGSALLTLYSMCGDIVGAENVFGGLSQPDIVSWNSMLSAYLEQGDAEKVLNLYRDMQNESVCQNEGTIVTALQACCVLAEKEGAAFDYSELTQNVPLEIGRALHADARKMGIDSLDFVYSALVIMYSKCGSIMDAVSMFDGLLQHDIVSWTALLSTYCEHGEAEKVLQLLRHIQEEGITPDAQTFVFALDACGKLAEKEEIVLREGQPVKVSCLKIAQALHADCVSLGCTSDAFVCSSLVNMYCQCVNLAEAEIVFDGLSHHSINLWNALLSAYVDHGLGEKALHLYRLLQGSGVLMNEFTLVCVLQACSLTGNVEICRQVHCLIECVGYNHCADVRSVLTYVYGSCASAIDSEATFNSLSQPDVVSWNALISAYARQGEYARSMQTFEQMQRMGTASNRVTALLLLSVFSHAGNVEGGVEYFQSMFRDYGIIPNKEHYKSMIDLLGRAGDFTKVKDMLSKDTVQPTLPIVLCVLGACQYHGNVELGKWAFDRAMHMQPKQARAYITMSNIYASLVMSNSLKEAGRASSECEKIQT